MSTLDEYRTKYGDLPGWFPDASQVIWDALLAFQLSEGIFGNLLEIGVYEGKSAALFSLHAQEGEKCLFVDPVLKANTIKLLEKVASSGAEFFQHKSEKLDEPTFLSKWSGTHRWIHIDGEHTGMAVMKDLYIADQLLGVGGIVCVDDFLCPAYVQITRTVFRFLDRYPERFVLLLCGFNKGYLCRPHAARTLRSYIATDFRQDLFDRDFEDFTLWRSTFPDDMNAFGITHKAFGTNVHGPDWAKDQLLV
ncbi:MAG: class I SAM-dependent methyltransferase [Pseudomonadota bacterium]